MSNTTEYPMPITGANLVAGSERAAGPAELTSIAPRTAERGGTEFHAATADELSAATTAAASAAPVMAATTGAERAAFLRDIADRLDAQSNELVSIADAETALGSPRLPGEVARTTAQLRMFAGLVDEGWHYGAVIDHADSDTTPPRPDLRRTNVPLGPVAVFGASNFPFAFSVAGGDTASALAAGCPVVVKAHPSHPATSEAVGRLIAEAVAAQGLPAGVFSLLHGGSPELGAGLVTSPQIAAVGFTGSLGAGRALFDAAAKRPTPIPVYAEMGSINPVVVTQGALAERSNDIAQGLAGSFTMGVGQFCTKPGVVFLPAGEAADAFAEQLVTATTDVAPGVLLNPNVQRGVAERLAATIGVAGVEVLLQGEVAADGLGFPVTVLRADAHTWLGQGALREEHFGPVIVLVTCGDAAERDTALAAVDGSLTATIHATDAEAASLADLTTQLRALAGRLIWNGFPTGVAVSHAQQHGGPYPATTAPGTTSVGTGAINRFLRPVVYQNAPEALLPPELHETNPLGVPRLVNGRIDPGATE